MNIRDLMIENYVSSSMFDNNVYLEVSGINYDSIEVYDKQKNRSIPIQTSGIFPIKLSKINIELFGFELYDFDVFDELDEIFDDNDSPNTTLCYKKNWPLSKKYLIGLDFFVEESYAQLYTFNPKNKKNDGRLIHHDIKYIHHLQNIYYIINGEHLKINI